MSRKTFEVDTLRERANALLVMPDSVNPLETLRERQAQRIGAIALIESVLHATGNYRGFRYLDSEYLPAAEQTSDSVLRPGYDDTRRRYL